MVNLFIEICKQKERAPVNANSFCFLEIKLFPETAGYA